MLQYVFALLWKYNITKMEGTIIGLLLYPSKNRNLFIQTHSTYGSCIYNPIQSTVWLSDLQIICHEANKQKRLNHLRYVIIGLVNARYMGGTKDYLTQRWLITNVTTQSSRLWDFYYKDILVSLHFVYWEGLLLPTRCVWVEWIRLLVTHCLSNYGTDMQWHP